MRARLPLFGEISQAKFSQFQSETALFRDSLEVFTVRSHRRRFSTAWYGTVRHGSVRYGTAQFGSVAFPPQFSTAIEWAGLFTRRYNCAASTAVTS